MKNTQPAPGVLLLEFPTVKEMTLTMARMAEFYESDNLKIRNHYFTFDQFVDHYSDHDGVLDYFSKWEGFNIPAKVLDKFWSKFRQDVSAREMEVFHDLDWSSGTEYIIAAVEGDKTTIMHELAHARYHLDKKYRKQVNELIVGLPTTFSVKLSRNLQNMHYNDKVLADEMNAYLVAYDSSETEVWKGILELVVKPHLKTFKDLYDSSSSSS